MCLPSPWRTLILLAPWLLTVAASAAADESGAALERLDRGLIARPVEGGKVYLGWRLLAADPDDVTMNVYRRTPSGETVKLNREPVRRTTDFVDGSPPKDAEAAWFVRTVVDGREGSDSPEAKVSRGEQPRPYVALKLDGPHTFQKAGIADLDGDGRYDFVLKQPGENIDPGEPYWKPSPDTYKLEAYAADGRFLWRHDLGWAIERGIWYSPYVVYDLDGDGHAEVAVKTGQRDPRDADGRVQTGPEHLSILDGRTGTPVARTDWPSREGFGEGLRGYNRASRNQLAVAYLDGRRPSLIVLRGTYNVIKVVAYRFSDGKLEEQWRWDNSNEPDTYWGQGAHSMHAADVDADGRDEIVLGSAVLDDDGKALWTTALGHPDHCYVGDIDPARPGLEIYYGIEARRKDGNGMCLVEARSGKILWGISEPTVHVHGQGLCSDLDAEHAGSECYSAESDPSRGKSLAWALLHNCRGEVLAREAIGGFAPYAAYWDADPQRELVVGGRIFDYNGPRTHAEFEGRVIAVADVLGDWREEIVTSVPGEMRIYTTTVPAADRRTCLMQDRLYRMDVVLAAMGYFQVPMTSYDLAAQGGGR